MESQQNNTARQRGAVLWLLFVLSSAVLFILNANSGFSYILRTEAPDGQFLYLLSKAIGVTALLMLWWQLFSALMVSTGFAQKARLSVFKPGRATHIIFGGLLAVLIISHAGLFISAVSLRQDSQALYLLLPNFSDYYHSGVSLGAIGFILVVIGIVTAMTRRYVLDIWRYGHRLLIIAFWLGCVHAAMIGSEVGTGFLFYLIIFLCFSIFLLAVIKAVRRYSYKK